MNYYENDIAFVNEVMLQHPDAGQSYPQIRDYIPSQGQVSDVIDRLMLSWYEKVVAAEEEAGRNPNTAYKNKIKEIKSRIKQRQKKQWKEIKIPDMNKIISGIFYYSLQTHLIFGIFSFEIIIIKCYNIFIKLLNK